LPPENDVFRVISFFRRLADEVYGTGNVVRRIGNVSTGTGNVVGETGNFGTGTGNLGGRTGHDLSRIGNLFGHTGNLVDHAGHDVSGIVNHVSCTGDNVSGVGHGVSRVGNLIPDLGKHLSNLGKHLSNLGKTVSDTSHRFRRLILKAFVTYFPAAASAFSNAHAVTMKHLFSGLFLLFATVAVLRAEETIAPARVAAFADWLPAQPAGLGPRITDRAAWTALTNFLDAPAIVAAGQHELQRKLTEVTDEMFLEFSRNGNRSHWQDAEFPHRERIAIFTGAEAFENQGRFLPTLEKAIADVCAEKTWVYPAHDAGLKNFHGEAITPDLGATGLAAELAEADYILGDKLSPATRQLLRENVRRRVLEPFRAMIEGRQPETFWIRAEMNWNAVCVGNTVFAALALEESRADRAFFAAAGEHCIRNFIRGFGADGYCAEGIGYWNYGFGHFVLLTETLRVATGGKVDLLADERAEAAALFCERAEILPGIFPSISDCNPGTQPERWLKNYVGQRLGLSAAPNLRPLYAKELALSMAYANAMQTPAVVKTVSVPAENPLRSYFPAGGVLIARNGEKNSAPFAVCLKGGHNDEPHNHNDVASFSVFAGTNMIVCDPGGEVYTARTFGKHRYESDVLNSFGHAVPVVAGELQRAGRDAHAIIVGTNFTDAADTWTLDYSSAYAVKTLRQLQRTFVFKRGAEPSLTVTDEVKFSKPQTFETALVTWGDVQQLDAHTLKITDGASALRVTVDTQGRGFHLKKTVIHENVHTARLPVHVGLVLDEKISSAVITLRLTPEQP
jgi:Heparinase II/III-like protein